MILTAYEPVYIVTNLETMQKDARELINRIKLEKDFKILIHDYKEKVGYIKPIIFADIDNDDQIDRLKSWRNENISAYLDQAPATFDGTKNWLKNNVLENSSRILFLVYNKRDEPIGHIGIADGLITDSLVEIDNIVRGDKAAQKGLISLALYELISWVFLSISTNKVYLRVFLTTIKQFQFTKICNLLTLVKSR